MTQLRRLWPISVRSMWRATPAAGARRCARERQVLLMALFLALERTPSVPRRFLRPSLTVFSSIAHNTGLHIVILHFWWIRLCETKLFMVGNTKFVRGIANLSTKSGRELCTAFPKTPRVEQYFHTSASLAHNEITDRIFRYTFFSSAGGCRNSTSLLYRIRRHLT